MRMPSVEPDFAKLVAELEYSRYIVTAAYEGEKERQFSTTSRTGLPGAYWTGLTSAIITGCCSSPWRSTTACCLSHSPSVAGSGSNPGTSRDLERLASTPLLRRGGRADECAGLE